MNGKRIWFNIYSKQAIKNVLNVYTKTTTSGWWTMWIDRWAPWCARWYTVLHHLHHWISMHCLSCAIITEIERIIQLYIIYICVCTKLFHEIPVTHYTCCHLCPYICGCVWWRPPDDSLTQQAIQNVTYVHSATHLIIIIYIKIKFDSQISPYEYIYSAPHVPCWV